MIPSGVGARRALSAPTFAWSDAGTDARNRPSSRCGRRTRHGPAVYRHSGVPGRGSLSHHPTVHSGVVAVYPEGSHMGRISRPFPWCAAVLQSSGVVTGRPPSLGSRPGSRPGEGDVTRSGSLRCAELTPVLYSNPGEPWRTSAALGGFWSRRSVFRRTLADLSGRLTVQLLTARLSVRVRPPEPSF